MRREEAAVDHGELQPGISNLACPVRNRLGETIAAVAIQAPSALMEANVDDWLAKLRAAAAESSHRLGWRDHAATPSTSHLID